MQFSCYLKHSTLYLGNLQGLGQNVRRHISHKGNASSIWDKRKFHTCNRGKHMTVNKINFLLSVKGGDHSEDLGTDGRIILK
jgi:hypothetical protein